MLLNASAAYDIKITVFINSENDTHHVARGSLSQNSSDVIYEGICMKIYGPKDDRLRNLHYSNVVFHFELANKNNIYFFTRDCILYYIS